MQRLSELDSVIHTNQKQSSDKYPFHVHLAYGLQ